jgi:hypothetical protein
VARGKLQVARRTLIVKLGISTPPLPPSPTVAARLQQRRLDARIPTPTFRAPKTPPTFLHPPPLPQTPPPRYQQQGEALQVERYRLLDELEAQKLNLRDINEFLTNELKARTAANAALDGRVAQLTQRMEELRRTSEVGGWGALLGRGSKGRGLGAQTT